MSSSLIISDLINLSSAININKKTDINTSNLKEIGFLEKLNIPSSCITSSEIGENGQTVYIYNFGETESKIKVNEKIDDIEYTVTEGDVTNILKHAVNGDVYVDGIYAYRKEVNSETKSYNNYNLNIPKGSAYRNIYC